MSKPGKNFRRGKKNTLYHFIGELIRERKYAWFVNREGRFRIKWEIAVERYIEYRAKKNPTKDLNIDRKRASNSFREGLLRRYRDDADGAKEYEECQKVGENKKIVEREFQMPSEVFHSLFGTSEELSGDQMSPKVFQSPFGSKEELSVDSNHETSSCASTSSEVDEKLQVFPDSGISDASDTGFEEAMDVSDAPQGNNKREDPFDPTNIATSDEIFHFSDEELLHSVLEDISTHSDSDVNQPEVVQDISPSSGSVKGGTRFHIMLKEALPESDTTVVANFDGIGEVFLAKTNPYTFSGTAPAAKEAGPVLITVYTGAGRKLGVTCFLYVDEMSEALKQLIKHPDLRSLFITMYQEYGIIGSNSNVAQTLGQFSLPDQGSLADDKQLPSLKVLQLLVYTAAHEGAQQLLEIIFSTSAGKIVFDSYKDRTPLPEDVARANGHDELAKFLQDLNERFSNASDSNSVSLGSSDWLELVQALDDIQKQTVFTTVSSDEQESSRMQPWDDDDQSDYFADAETSSCGSLEFNGDWSDLEEENGACTEDEDCKNATIETGNDNCASLRHYPHEEPLRTSLGFSEENAATKESFEDETQSGNFQHSIIQLVPVISPSSGSVKVIYAATKESFEDETQSGNFQHSIIQLVPVISPSSGSVKREREGMELYPAQINFLPEDEKQQVIRDFKTKAENIEETSRSFLETAKKLVDVCPIYRIVCVRRLEAHVPLMGVVLAIGRAAVAASPLSVTGFSIGSAGATSNSGTVTVDSHANSAEMKKAEKQLAKIRESINEVHTIVQKVLRVK